ncbi:unnamed protein product [Pleuronectes platessa]|uniref:Uncharacterized protein n=1 Tax=Pleuronectes platessa TaxID=8262 RepID=A0A9N7USV6_PLEPL|nr:unnamed protein product [Pleuronectes platessa]
MQGCRTGCSSLMNRAISLSRGYRAACHLPAHYQNGVHDGLLSSAGAPTGITGNQFHFLYVRVRRVALAAEQNSHLIGKQGRSTTTSRSTPQAAVPFFRILDDLEIVRAEEGNEPALVGATGRTPLCTQRQMKHMTYIIVENGEETDEKHQQC